MVPLGQQLFDNFADALEETVVCVMTRADVRRLLLSDPQIAAGNAKILCSHLPKWSAGSRTPRVAVEVLDELA